MVYITLLVTQRMTLTIITVHLVGMMVMFILILDFQVIHIHMSLMCRPLPLSGIITITRRLHTLTHPLIIQAVAAAQVVQEEQAVLEVLAAQAAQAVQVEQAVRAQVQRENEEGQVAVALSLSLPILLLVLLLTILVQD
jgi:hypothetical protein